MKLANSAFHHKLYTEPLSPCRPKMFVRTLRMSFSGLILLQILFFLQTSYGKQSAYCDPSACGNIRNISYPFRLRDDPQHCGNSNYQLVCENNTTFLDYYSDHRKYRVESINYQNYTIRLSDTSVITNNSCSFPQNSLNPSEYPYRLPSYPYYPYSFLYFEDNTFLGHTATFLSCPYLVNQSSYIAFDLCVENDSISRHKYVKLGHLSASEVRDQCSIDLVVMATIPFGEYNNISLEQIHRSLLFGFEVSWFNGGAACSKCEGNSYCEWDGKASVCSSGLRGPYEVNYFQMMFGPYPVRWRLEAMEELIASMIVFITGIKIVIGLPIFLGLLVYKLRRRHLSMFDVIEGFLQSHNHLSPIRYSYSNIKKMTGSFREKLGQGGYGSVYKGKLQSGHDVAVKKLIIKSGSNGQDFMNEVSTIGRIHHVNVIRLVGYCAERSKRALIYDFMPNGSLDKCILGQESTSMLSWEKKFDIAVGVARGIEYLHRGCDIQILHFDIKPHNILLDQNFTPKISDFGLARFYPTENNTVKLTAARGTIGYVAPELINRSIGNISYKADVYSYGMLLMEMVGLKRDLVKNGDESSQYFPHWIYSHLNKWKDIEAGIVDIDERITRKMAIVALWCIQMSPGDRPSMSKVIEMLEEEVESLQIPPQPSYSEPQFTCQDWETDTTDSVRILAV